MLYKVTVLLESTVTDFEHLRHLNSEVSQTILKETDDNAHFSIVRASATELLFYGITFVRFEHQEGNVEQLIERYVQDCGLEFKSLKVERVYYQNFSSKLEYGFRRNPNNTETIIDLEEFSPSFTQYSFRNLNLGEAFVEAKKGLQALAFKDAYSHEKKRIEDSKQKQFVGHPVHYKVISGRKSDAQDVSKQITSDLFQSHRLVYPYYISLAFEREPSDIGAIDLAGIEIALGGACFIDLSEFEFQEYENSMVESYARNLAEIIKKYRHQIVFFLYSNDANSRILRIIDPYLNKLSFITLKEDQLNRRHALQFLKETLEEVHLDPKLATTLLPKGDAFFVKDVMEYFNAWYDDYLKDELYPQYKDVPKQNVSPVLIPDGNAYQELQAMIGLEDIKTLVDEYLNLQKAQHLYHRFDIQLPKMTRHMVFTGAPGTAKTSVARLIGRILKDHRLLSVGDFYEVGRSDLIDKYVGWTARNVKKYFKMAQGSILFIDEAYSLMDADDHRQSYGDEAIATIVQEMENRRDDIVVIFAGYTEPMKRFLDANPGLASRLGFNINFKSYTNDELLRIAFKITLDYGFNWDESVESALLKNIAVLKAQDHFGNGRSMRSVIEKAILNHGSKLAELNPDSMTETQLRTLNLSDFNFIESSIPEYQWYRKVQKELH